MPSAKELEREGLALELRGVSVDRGRVDTFRRVNGRWQWIDYWRYRAERTHLPVKDRDSLGVLLRSSIRPDRYAWGECDSSKPMCELGWYHTVRIGGALQESSVVLFAGDDPVELSPLIGGYAQFVPARNGLLCAYDDGHAMCGIVGPDTNEVAAHNTDRPTRVLRLSEMCSGVKVALHEPGRAAILPKAVPFETVCMAKWLAIAGATQSAILDIESTQFAHSRFVANALAVLPGFTSVQGETSRGVTVKPVVDDTDNSSNAIGATLYAFTTESDNAARIPVASIKVDDKGLAEFPSLGAGRYRLKLVGRRVSRKTIDAELNVGVVSRVKFQSGAIVKGRLRGLVGVGDPSVALPLVRVTPELLTADEGEPRDLEDRINAMRTDLEGEFVLSLTALGKYALSAEYGSARAYRTFEIKSESDVIDLGDINLGSGVILRGTLTGCGATHLSVVRQPDPEKPSPGQYVRVPVGADGSIYVEGLSAGNWMAMAVCGDQLLGAVTPATFVAMEGAPLVIDFVATESGVQ